MTVLVLHGFMGSAAGMRPFCDSLAEVLLQDGPGRQVVAIDLVGHGDAPKPASVTDYTMAAAVEGVLGQIDQLSGGEPVDVFGYSMGGRVALNLVLTHPNLVRRVAVLGASPGLADPAEREQRVTADDILADRLSAEGIETFVDHWLALPMFENLKSLGNSWFETYRNERLAGDPDAFAKSLRGMGAGAMPPLHDALGGLVVPALFLAGARDQKFCALGASMAACVADGSFLAIPNAGHAAHLEAPQAVHTAVAGFLTA